MFADTAPGRSAEKNNPPSAPQGPDARNPRTCITCKRRKVKCDRKSPCANCIKAQIPCNYPPPGRAPRQPRRGMRLQDKRNLPELVDQVWELMAKAMEQGINPNRAALKQPHGGELPSQVRGTSDRPAALRVVGMDESSGSRNLSVLKGPVIASGSSQMQKQTQPPGDAPGQLDIAEGKSQYIPSPFWASMSESIKEGIQEILEGDDYETEDETSFMPPDFPVDSNHHGFIMGYNSVDVDLKKLHPPRSQIPVYWQTFQMRVNPVTKLVHVPTMDNLMEEVQNNLNTLSESTEALMFSIYYATIVSMPPEDVVAGMHAEKDYLLRRYRFAVEQALAKAKFLDTTEIVTLQAFVIFLVCVRTDDDSRFVWTLTGLAIRLAQALGLHRDGTKFGISPFNTEMRRRLWWQICILDVRASEDHGFELSIRDQSFDTKFPLSINDTDIQPDTTETPVPETGVSEMTPCLIRMEICHLTRRLFYASPGDSALPVKSEPLSFEDREKMLKETADRMEEQYLQYCTYAGPVYWSAAVVCRLILAKTALLIYQPLTHPAKPNELPQATKDRLFVASIEIIEFARTLAMDPMSGRFSWLFKTYTQWHAIAYILSELAVRPPSPLVERAWGAVIIFRDAGVINSSKRTGMLWKPLRLLLAKALRKREDNKRLQPSGYYGLSMEGQYAHPQASAGHHNPNFVSAPSVPNLDFQPPPHAYYQTPGAFVQQPQYPGTAPSFAADPRVVLMQEQQLVQMQNQPPFLVDETEMQGLGMANLDMADVDPNWDGWNQLVPGYHTGPTQNWWGA